jgi:hypothetical protein
MPLNCQKSHTIAAFTRFLDVAAHFNAEQVNYTQIGSDAEVPPRTIRDYVTILEDTMLPHVLPAFKGRQRKTAATARSISSMWVLLMRWPGDHRCLKERVSGARRWSSLFFLSSKPRSRIDASTHG